MEGADKSCPSCPGDDEWMKGVGGGLDLGSIPKELMLTSRAGALRQYSRAQRC